MARRNVVGGAFAVVLIITMIYIITTNSGTDGSKPVNKTSTVQTSAGPTSTPGPSQANVSSDGTIAQTTCDLNTEELKAWMRDPCNFQSTSVAALNMQMSNATVTATVTCGQVLQYMQPQTQPSVTFASASEDKVYSLILVDLDAPALPPGSAIDNLVFFLHWAVADVEGRDFIQGTDTYYTLMEYQPPTPPDRRHQYQLMMFETLSGANEHFTTRVPWLLSTMNVCKFVAGFSFNVDMMQHGGGGMPVGK